MVPLPLPKNSRPPTIVGWANTVLAEGNPKAHFTFNFGTSSARSPAASVVCILVLTRSTPHPFQPLRLESGAAPGAHELDAAGSAEALARGERKSATACFSAAVSVAPWAFMAPVSSAAIMAPFGTRWTASSVGVRLSASGLWQNAQFFWNMALPSGGGACAATQPI